MFWVQFGLSTNSLGIPVSYDDETIQQLEREIRAEDIVIHPSKFLIYTVAFLQKRSYSCRCIDHHHHSAFKFLTEKSLLIEGFRGKFTHSRDQKNRETERREIYHRYIIETRRESERGSAQRDRSEIISIHTRCRSSGEETQRRSMAMAQAQFQKRQLRHREKEYTFPCYGTETDMATAQSYGTGKDRSRDSQFLWHFQIT
jgi:hypothetical protein